MNAEARIRKLEKTVSQQGYIINILLILLPFSVTGMLLLWNEKGAPDYDHIGASITVFQTLFGIAAIYGFWSLRGLTREKAEEVTEQELAKIAPPIISRIVAEALEGYGNDAYISDKKLESMIDQLDGREGEGGK